MYEYTATIVRVVDGDTMDLLIDLGLETLKKTRVRLARINCPEINTTEGVAAYNISKQWEGQTIRIQTIKDKKEKYGRYLAEVFVPTSTGDMNLNDHLVSLKLAVYKKY